MSTMTKLRRELSAYQATEEIEMATVPSESKLIIRTVLLEYDLMRLIEKKTKGMQYTYSVKSERIDSVSNQLKIVIKETDGTKRNAKLN